MRVGVLRVLACVACLAWLPGCETTGSTGAKGASSLDGEPETTGSIGKSPPPPGTAVVANDTPPDTGLEGDTPYDDLNLGKKHYREGSFGLAEQHFRRAAEKGPQTLEAWVGLAASYDKLKRFDLADRAYAQAIRIAGPTPEILNNQGYSYLLRGDRRRARAKLLEAQSKDPENPYIQNNLNLLSESLAKGSAVQ